MKKTFFVIMLFFAGISLTSAQQYFGGGSINFKTSGGKTDGGGTSVDKPSSTSFSFSPMGGIILSEKMYVGVQLGLSMQRQKTPGNPDVIDKSSGFSLTPFARYYALQSGKFSLYGQGQLGIGFSSSKQETGSTTTDGPKNSYVSLSVFPGVAYNLSDKVELNATINGFNFGLSRSVSKQDIAGTEVKDIDTNFGFGATTNNLVTTGNISIGAIIKF